MIGNLQALRLSMFSKPNKWWAINTGGAALALQDYRDSQADLTEIRTLVSHGIIQYNFLSWFTKVKLKHEEK